MYETSFSIPYFSTEASVSPPPAIENALLDVKAKLLGVPCYELLGGKIRDRIRVYWSHCATWRINHPRSEEHTSELQSP